MLWKKAKAAVPAAAFKTEHTVAGNENHVPLFQDDSLQFDANLWLDEFRRAKSQNDREALKRLRDFVLQETASVAKAERYFIDAGKEVSLKSLAVMAGGRLPPSSLEVLEEEEETIHHVLASECFDVASFLKTKKALNPVVVVFGKQNSSLEAGSIHRRSNLLSQSLDGYLPDVIVFRASEARGYAFLAAPEKIPVICSTSLSVQALGKDGRLRRDDAKLIETKIKTILATALQTGHDSIVFGPGVNQTSFAEPFHRVFKSRRFSKAFRYVAFAIQDGDESVLNVFQQIF